MHPLAKGRLPALADLQGEPLITFSLADGHYFYHLIDELLGRTSIFPRYVQQVSQIHSILALVSAGLGVALVPETARMLHFSGSVLRPLKMPPVYADLHLVWRSDNENPRYRPLLSWWRDRCLRWVSTDATQLHLYQFDIVR